MSMLKPKSSGTDSFVSSLKGKTILITGGTGSFGKKCIETIVRTCAPAKVIVFSRDELKQHDMQTHGFNQPVLRYFVGDVRDRERLMRAMRGVDYVIHAAALKQVPSCEYNPMEAIMTNVLGTRNVIEAAIDTGVKKVIALSTDKAVNPVNLYGATKLCAEKLIVQSNSYSGDTGTKFSSVRYGNVVGSRGSVLPAFLEQKTTGTLKVTDERMTRFWLTLEQGVEFVLNCLTSMKGGEVFVPKIPSTKITDFARVIAPECKIDIVGIRPGEKLHEILLGEDEARHSRELPNMYVIHPTHPWWNDDAPEEGKALPEGFAYTSEKNDWYLTDAELSSLIEMQGETGSTKRRAVQR